MIVFLAILIRGSRAYEDEFSKNPIAYGQQHFADLASEEDIAQFIKDQTRTSPPQPKPEATEVEYALLYDAFSHHQNANAEDLVCETEEWVEQVSQDRLSKQLVLLCHPCLEALGKEPGLHFMPVKRKPGWGIWVLRSQDRLLLIVPATKETADESKRTASEIAGRLDGKDATEVLRASQRAYPAIILADDDLWIDLEREPVANMALSPEESEILESARRPENPFPLFINGRAGSGKSTILQYLFADLLFYYLTKLGVGVMAPPIYLTANGELLRVARSFVERLLRSGATFTQQAGANVLVDNREVLDEAFQQFQPHLLSLLPPEDRINRFRLATRVDYARFRRIWMDRFSKEQRALREYGPDLSWHVIRSYIKGMSSETYLEPEDYAQLPEKQLTVTHAAYKLVYDKVWTNWYQRIFEEEGLWDDQDLARYVLDHDLAKPMYPAVLCDEAQDFTRLELEILLRINLFSNRSLPPTDICRVPFAFAGDQFQTLNPTGFRWDAIKASFVEKFIFELDPAQRSGRTDLNYRELKYNYRSSHRIVYFSNHVQAMRAALFQLPDLRPQEPWTKDPRSLPVVWFRANDAAFWNRYRENAGFVVIIPCNEGEELSYVRDDPILQEHIKIEDGVPQNVLSAARAKGCEYPAVLVYGFGALMDKDIVSYLHSEALRASLDPDKSLPLQYFINKLYVAVSRPKRRLVIVDTEDGFKRLWKCTQDVEIERLMLDKIRNGRQIWGNVIEGMTIGNFEDLTSENVVDSLENARVFEKDGLARNDPFLLKQAAQAYRTGGDHAKYRECRSRALEADGDFFEAGEAYFEADFAIPDGVRCLWKSGSKGWKRLCELVVDHPQIGRETEYQLALGITEKQTPRNVAVILKDFAQRLHNDKRFAEDCTGDLVWSEALSALLQSLFSKERIMLDQHLADQLADQLDRIHQKGISLSPEVHAQVCFAAKRYPEAIAAWDKSGNTRSPRYYQARAATDAYPESIVWLSKLEASNEIVKAYSAATQASLNQEQATIVCDSLRYVGRLTDALDLAWDAVLSASMLDIALDAFRKVEQTIAKTALHSAIQLLTIQGKWDVLLGIMSSQDFAPNHEWKDKSVKDWIESVSDEIQITLVQALARSDELPKARSNHQQQVSKFLRNYLRVKDRKWMSHLSIPEAGAAFERAGRFTDTIAFYEAVLKEKSTKEDKRFAQTRWLISKKQQLDYERLSGSTDRAGEIEDEIHRLQKNWRITEIADIPQYPELPPLDRPAIRLASTQVPVEPHVAVEVSPEDLGDAIPDHVHIVAGHFKMEISRKNRRCNITHNETMDTAYVKIGEKKCGGEADFIQTNERHWESNLWRMAVEFPTGSEKTLTIQLKEFGINLGIRI